MPSLSSPQQTIDPGADPSSSWMDEESQEWHFKDVRLGKRFRKLLEQMFKRLGHSIPVACRDWANTKAAYRFFANERVSEKEILAGHFEATRERFAATEGPVLILHDTTEFSYRREKYAKTGRTPTALRNHYTVRSILMHSSLAVTPDGLPLGLTSIKFWTRKKFTGQNALKKKSPSTRLPGGKRESLRWLDNLRQASALVGAPQRCVHIGDRESDIYEFFCAAQEAGTHFVVRTCVDRLAGEDDQTIAEQMEKAPVAGVYRLQSRTKTGASYEADLEIKYQLLRVRPPVRKEKRYPDQMLTVIYATEVGDPEGREKVAWKLMTNLPVRSLAEAIEKLEWYASRWKIETFHKILKSGCKAEESKLQTSERVVNLIAVFCIMSWRIFWMTMLNRTAPEAPPEAALTPQEIQLLDRLQPGQPWDPPPKRILSEYLTKIACLGGYLARKNDPAPGNMVMWRGMSRLTDIQIGFDLAAGNYG